jgi:hypothetical protein
MSVVFFIAQSCQDWDEYCYSFCCEQRIIETGKKYLPVKWFRAVSCRCSDRSFGISKAYESLWATQMRDYFNGESPSSV